MVGLVLIVELFTSISADGQKSRFRVCLQWQPRKKRQGPQDGKAALDLRYGTDHATVSTLT